MKTKDFNPGGRPPQEGIDNKKYVVSTRLDTFEYLKLKELIDTSGRKPAEVLREVISRG